MGKGGEQINQKGLFLLIFWVLIEFWLNFLAESCHKKRCYLHVISGILGIYAMPISNKVEKSILKIEVQKSRRKH